VIRNPVVAGQYYPASAARIREMMQSFIDPGAEKDEAIGVMVPHAGYPYSGAVVGAVLSRIKIKDTFIIMGPSHTGQGQPFSLMTSGTWKTPMGDVEIDSELAAELLEKSRYLEDDASAHESEHSLEVQLPFLQYLKPGIRFVPIIFGSGNGTILKEIGLEIAAVLRETKKEAVIMASSDMNHYESQKITREKDRQAIDAVLDMDPDELLRRVARQNISMCGYAPAVVMLSAAAALGADKAELVKYQTSGDVVGDYSAVVGYAGILVKKTSPLVKLARQSLESYIRERKVIEPAELTPEMKEQAGVFVCIKKYGDLRGCIGTFEPTRENVAEEIIANAISTATSDPRFNPVTASELKDLDYTVDVLTHPVPVRNMNELDPRKYGIIVESGFRRGLLLPDLEGVDSVEQQIEICRQKAGIDPDEPVTLYKFEVKRYK